MADDREDERPEEAVKEAATDERSEEEEVVVAALPPIDELTTDSDFTPFLDRRVPAALRRAALRKLWNSDPIFANLDGLNDYDDDFRTLGVGQMVRTAYEVGKGFVKAVEKIAEEEEPKTAETLPDEDENETKV